MKHIRIIPKLDIKGPNLVKGIHLEGLRVLGNPEEYAKLLSEMGADEIIYQDTVASLYGRNSLNDLVSKTARSCFIPLTVGGGIRSIEDIKDLLKAGADKVSINTAFINNPSFAKESSRLFGSSTIVASIEAINYEGEFLAFTDNGREYTGKKVLDWVLELQDCGVGEILLTSVDNEGTGEGYNLDLYRLVKEKLEIPLIFHGGAKEPKHFLDLLNISDVDAFGASSIFHYGLLNLNRIKNKSNDHGNTEYLSKNISFKDFGEFTVTSVKEALSNAGYNLRIENEK